MSCHCVVKLLASMFSVLGFLLHLVYLLLAIVCVLSLFNIEKKGFINFAEEVNKKEL